LFRWERTPPPVIAGLRHNFELNSVIGEARGLTFERGSGVRRGRNERNLMTRAMSEA
jgi:hypothetical protein